MKKLFVFLFIQIFFFSAFSQIFLGVEAGASIYNVTRAVPGISIPGFSLGSAETYGFAGGAVSEIKIWRRFNLRPELGFVQKGARLTSDIISYTVPGRYTINYLRLPLNVTYNHKLGPGKIFGGLGPELGYGLSGKGKGDNGKTVKLKMDGKDISTTSSELHLKPFDYGVSFIAGYKMENGLFLSGGYFLGLADIDPDKDFTWKNHGFTISIGYLMPVNN